jgi:sigma-B regulation protein RsbU (phosphoserine phosphatase)
MFGKKRFRSVISQNANKGATHILNAVYEELDHFTKGLKSEDDITLVVAKVDNQ